MAYKATLKISAQGGTFEYDVLSCHFNFSRNLGHAGSNRDVGALALNDGLIYIEIESVGNSKFFGMMLQPEYFKGSIIFYKPDSDQKLKQIDFKNGFIAQYSESMVSTGNVSMTTNLAISTQEITIEGDMASWKWNNLKSGQA